ncbi:MAG: hypothetical protein F6J95_026110 [Leptolyngbya sp. SIO1E4]|nr:hypothetical protein [Leptolyngbya sp. SIO1E4]
MLRHLAGVAHAGGAHGCIDDVDYVDVKRHGVDDYLASYPDLIRAFGNDLHAAETPYNVFGGNEGRVADTFDEL